ncbi:MAG TPA: fumarylacetoacetate hydrolase family protein, partial [Pyrinomonadaceae bacterium]|nr:fumarylacetoacetate hydrolase family protein [Pyrinomonadaceae bacterium]
RRQTQKLFRNHMKICRIKHSSFPEPRFGVIEGDDVLVLLSDFTFLNSQNRRFESKLKLDDVSLVAPVTPSKIVCVGRNYREHAAELGNKMPDEPLLFLKPPSSLIASRDRIELPAASQQVEHEGELGVVIGKQARKLSDQDNPLDYIFGYTCVNDVTARDLQRKDVQFTRGKGFDTFCPVGPWVVTDLDAQATQVMTRVNGTVKQDGNTRDMAFPVSFLIRYISAIMTLNPGDLIATGTPAGVSRLNHGDIVEIEVGGVGVLSNEVYDPRRDVEESKQ